jgi:hypothetical protein
MTSTRLFQWAAACAALGVAGSTPLFAIGAIATVPDAQWGGTTNTQAIADTDDPNGSQAFDAKSASVTGSGVVTLTSNAANSYGGVAGAATSKSTVAGSAAQHVLTSSLDQQTPAFSSSTYGDASATLSYSILILGPAAFVPVHLVADGAVAGQFWGEASDFGALGFSTLGITDAPGAPATPLGQVSASAGFGLGSFGSLSGVPSSFALNGVYQAATNSVYTIDMGFTTTGYLLSSDAGPGHLSLSSTVDPWFFIDDPDYTIVLSPGVGNGPPVPDSAATGLLFVVGIAGLAGARRWLR